MIPSLIRIVLFAIGITVMAFVYFAIVFGLADYINGALATRDGAYQLGQRVGFTAFMIGPVLGSVVGLMASWNRHYDGLRHGDGSPAWFARLVAIAVTIAIVMPLIEHIGFGPISDALRHYGKLSWPACLAFIGLGLAMSTLP
jgi:galactitol-specific phosphotransferase system IIC component